MSFYEWGICLSAGILNGAVCGIVVFSAFGIIRFEGFRSVVSEAVQDADGKFHWLDARNFAFLVAGFLSAWFTMNLAFIFCFSKMFDPGPLAVLVFFSGITFTLWGIAWKKPVIKF